MDIALEIKELADSAMRLVRGTPEEGRARSYWYPHIVMAVSDDHGYMGKNMATMSGSAEALMNGEDEEYMDEARAPHPLLKAAQKNLVDLASGEVRKREDAKRAAAKREREYAKQAARAANPKKPTLDQIWQRVEHAISNYFPDGDPTDYLNPNTRRDLELDALVEILNKKRFITCHSYVQPEITYIMRVADKYNFTVNTFTHILEGYKVADKMKKHGSNASTFSDWWNYKMEVVDAMPYNATIMSKVGLNVAINSDDAEMARRLNQEAAKSIKYGGMSEEDALKMVTLNPAKMLHLDNRLGSIKAGKDADVVLWNNNPLSVYAKPEKVIIDGATYFDIEKDKQLRASIAAERNRITQKMLNAKAGGAATVKPEAKRPRLFHCNSEGDLTEEVGGFKEKGLS